MSIKKIALAAFLSVTSVLPSLGESYADHRGVTRFTQGLCGEVLDVLSPDAIPDGHEFEPERAEAFGKEFGQAVAAQGMAWGFILGYDTANGGLGRDGFTTLELFRAKCRQDPQATGIAILESLAPNPR